MNWPGNCPVCGAAEGFKEVEKVDKFTIFYCPSCDVEFSSPMENPGKDWYDKAYVIRHSAIDDQIKGHYRWVIRNLPCDGKLLDVGCAEGVFVNYAKKNGLDAYGVDFSVEAIKFGRMWFKMDTLFNYSFSELKTKEDMNEFDVITFFEVFEHLEDPRGFITEVKSLLKKGGFIALSVPNKVRWPVREFNDYPPHHLTRWTEKSLKNFLEFNGFRVVGIHLGSRAKSYNVFLGYLIRILLYKIFGRHRKGLADYSTRRGTGFLKKPGTKRILSYLKLRQIKNAVLWPFTIVSYPFVFSYFKGYNMVAVCRLEGK